MSIHKPKQVMDVMRFIFQSSKNFSFYPILWIAIVMPQVIMLSVGDDEPGLFQVYPCDRINKNNHKLIPFT